MAVQELGGLVDYATVSQTPTAEEVAHCIVVVQTVADQAGAAGTIAAPELRYNNLQAIQQRYNKARQISIMRSLRAVLKLTNSIRRQ